jgi:hypothetical protein
MRSLLFRELVDVIENAVELDGDCALIGFPAHAFDESDQFVAVFQEPIRDDVRVNDLRVFAAQSRRGSSVG